MKILFLINFKSHYIIIVYGGLEMIRKIKSVAISYDGRSRVQIPVRIRDLSLLQIIPQSLGPTQLPI